MRRDRWPCAASAAALSLSLSLSLLPIAVVAAAQQSVSVSVFVPGYRASAWEGLRGSVITSVGVLYYFCSLFTLGLSID